MDGAACGLRWRVAPVGVDGPYGIRCAKVRLSKVEQEEPSVSQITRVAVDTSKAVFTVHAVDATGRAVLRRNLRRQDLVAFFTKLPAAEIVLEACGGSHHWGRTLAAMGHQVRLIPPQYVKPFVKRGKNDRNDAEAISEPAPAGEALGVLGSEIDRVEARLVQIEAKLLAQARTNPDCRRLAGVPGIGPIGALNFAVRVDATQFASGRHVSAWLGLVPRDNSTGGKQRLGGISRAGDERLRQLLVLGAMSVIRNASARRSKASPWLSKLLERKPRKVAAVALANKMARVVWAMLARGEDDRQPAAAAD